MKLISTLIVLAAILVSACSDANNEPEPDPGNDRSCEPDEVLDGECTCLRGGPGRQTCEDGYWSLTCECLPECEVLDERDGCTCPKGRAGYNVCNPDRLWSDECYCRVMIDPGTPCEDNLDCTLDTVFQEDGTCGGGTSACDAMIEWPECKKSTCDEERGCAFQGRREGLECDDGDDSTVDDVCRGGSCVGTAM